MDAATTPPIVDVNVSSNVVSFTGLNSDNQVGLPLEGGRVVFRLRPDTVGSPSAPTVGFPSEPIQWTEKVGDDFLPIPNPPGTTVRRVSGTRAFIDIANSTQEPQSYSFFVIVQTTGGKFFGTDPTIVTMRPGGGSGSQDPDSSPPNQGNENQRRS
jgi:hypothetical protein